jgi:hypothetical protein
MSSKKTKTNHELVTMIFNDLDKYLNFCKGYGYRYDESDLYNNRSYVWRQYTKFLAGKEVKNQWELNAR